MGSPTFGAALRTRILRQASRARQTGHFSRRDARNRACIGGRYNARRDTHELFPPRPSIFDRRLRPRSPGVRSGTDADPDAHADAHADSHASVPLGGLRDLDVRGRALDGRPIGNFDGANIVKDSAGNLWGVAASDDSISRWSADRTTLTRWVMTQFTAPSSLFPDTDGTFWITELGGFKIAHFDPATGNCTEYIDAARRPTTLVRRPDGKFWMTETGGHMALFDPSVPNFTYYVTPGVFYLSYPWQDADGTLFSADFVYGYLVSWATDVSSRDDLDPSRHVPRALEDRAPRRRQALDLVLRLVAARPLRRDDRHAGHLQPFGRRALRHSQLPGSRLVHGRDRTRSGSSIPRSRSLRRRRCCR